MTITLKLKPFRTFQLSDVCKLHAALVSAQLAFAGFEILSRVALLKGAGKIAFSFYRNVLATVLLGVSGYFLEKGQRPSLTFNNCCLFFFLGFLGVTVNQVCYLEGLKYTSPIFASAMRNTTPVFTFIVAVICRMETVRFQNLDGIAKMVGSSLAIGGSVVLSIYKGPVVLRSKLSILHISQVRPNQSVVNSSLQTITILGLIHVRMQSWELGAIFLAISCIAFATFLILQVPALRRYPAPVSLAAISCFSSVVQLPILGVIYESQGSKWTFTGASEITSIIYAGFIASGLVSGIQSWGVHKGGPVIVAAYQPLETIATAILSFVFLEESIHLGSIIGGVLVISGLYLLIWGQAREHKIMALKVVDDSEVPIRPRAPRFSFDLIAAPVRLEPNGEIIGASDNPSASFRNSFNNTQINIPRLSEDQPRRSRFSSEKLSRLPINE